jgi:hypothetical protein
VDWLAVPIDAGVPPPLARRQKLGADYWQQVLARLHTPGLSMAVPDGTPGLQALIRIISLVHKTTQLRYRTMRAEGVVRIFRVADGQPV